MIMRPWSFGIATLFVSAGISFVQSPLASPHPVSVVWPSWPKRWPDQAPGAFLGTAGPDGVVITDGNVFSRSPDDGVHWLTHLFPNNVMLDAVSFRNAEDGTILGQRITTQATPWIRLVTVDGGRHWHVLPIRGLNAGSGADTIVTSPNGALTVLTVSPNYSWSPGPADLSIRGGRFYPLRLPVGFSAWDAAFNQRGDLFLAGQLGPTGSPRGALLESTDNGHSFRLVDTVPVPLMGIDFLGGHGIAVGGSPQPKGLSSPLASQVALVSNNDGATWHPVYHASHQPVNFSRVRWIGPTTAMAVGGVVEIGANGPGYQAVWRTTDGGVHWTPVLAGYLSSYLLRTPKDLWVVDNGVLIASRDDGALWSPVPRATPLPVTTMTLLPGTGFVSVNLGVGTAVYRRVGTTWTRLGWENGAVFPITWVGPETGFYPYGNDRIRLTTDGGRRWQPVNLPPDPGGGPDSITFVNARTGWVAMQGLGADDQDRLYATTDGGHRWTPLASVPDTSLLTFQTPHDGLDITGSAWGITRDGGRHWVWHPMPANAVAGPGAWQPGGPVWLFVSILEPSSVSRSQLWLCDPDGRRTVLPFPIPAGPTALTFATASFGWLLVNGVLFATHDGGAHWMRVPLTLPSPPAVPGVGLPMMNPPS
jgi:photosystem II stability/assembly factor-like uncharacterized protein